MSFLLVGVRRRKFCSTLNKLLRNTEKLTTGLAELQLLAAQARLPAEARSTARYAMEGKDDAIRSLDEMKRKYCVGE
mgnify:CR=1 FL=1